MTARIKALIAAATVAYLAAACDAGPPSDDASTTVREVAFTCTNGPDLSVRFFPDQEIAVLVRNGETVELQQQPSASGFIYSSGPTTIRGKGEDLTVEIGRMVPLQCQARPT